ncbi:MAG TPA: type II toxin-antitoxin system VapC family toxin [Anaeromyxobacteraceae bacterium]|nr:type II toxin-antitoxin system VapC family toxin [Anaeromyxobacteraceae bacterium]
MARALIVLDTHALLWWALDPDKLSPGARRACERMEGEGGFASSISIWELGVKVQRGKLDLGIAVDELARRIEGTAVELLAVDTRTWLRSLALDWDHRDPADRVIVATALLRGLPVLTKDASLRAFAGVQCVW